jgi:hypothetical protein
MPRACLSPFQARVIKLLGGGLSGIPIVSSARRPVRIKPISAISYCEWADTSRECLQDIRQCLPGVTLTGLDLGRDGTAYGSGRK